MSDEMRRSRDNAATDREREGWPESPGEELLRLRRVAAMQSEVLQQLHAEGDVRSRSGDGGGLRRALESLTLLLTGIVLGCLGTLASLNGKISTIEAVQLQHAAALARFDQRGDALLQGQQEMTVKLERLVARFPH